MKKTSEIFFIFLCVVLILVAGCTSKGTTSAATVETPTPQIVYVTVTVTPATANPDAASTSQAIASPTISKGQTIAPKYSVGDVIYDRNDMSHTKGKVIILSFDPIADQYGFSSILKNPDDTWGVRINSSVISGDRDRVETYLPDKAGTVLLSRVKIDTHTFDNVDNSQGSVRKLLNTVNTDLRFNVITDLITDGKKLKDLADSEYKLYNPQDEYAKYLFLVSRLGNNLNRWGEAYRDKQKNVALAYADLSLTDVRDIKIILDKMKYSDRYSIGADMFADDIINYENINTGIVDSRDHTQIFL
jgi:hypothetical protein